MTGPSVYRAPLRSRDDRVAPATTQHRALSESLVGVGEATDQRAVHRLQRFCAVADGSSVWTLVAGDYHLGRVSGPCREDRGPAAVAVDLVHVRGCDWLPEPVDPALVPPQVRHAFSRGGRNFQRIRIDGVEQATARVWHLLG